MESTTSANIVESVCDIDSDPVNKDNGQSVKKRVPKRDYRVGKKHAKYSMQDKARVIELLEKDTKTFELELFNDYAYPIPTSEQNFMGFESEDEEHMEGDEGASQCTKPCLSRASTLVLTSTQVGYVMYLMYPIMIDSNDEVMGDVDDVVSIINIWLFVINRRGVGQCQASDSGQQTWYGVAGVR